MKRVYFKEDPTIEGLKTVTTINGETEYLTNCKKIKSEYHIIDKDCFLINNKWYRVSSGLIEYDNETKNWIVIKDTPALTKGLIGFDKSGSPVLGKFSRNPYNNCKYYYRDREYIVMNSEILLQAGKIEDFSTGGWYDKAEVRVSDCQTPKNVLDHTAQGYNIEDNKEDFETKQLLYENYTPILSKDVRSYGHMLGDTTFGLEIECSHGFLPPHIQNRTGVVICRDGSLKDENGRPGPEFVTVPLKGSKGLQTISTLSKELVKRTKLSLNCSFHIHFGTIPTTRNYIVTLFRLCNRIQNELFTMFPYYKVNPDGVKNKNYNRKLPTLSIFKANKAMCKEEFDNYINKSYYQIFNWLAEGYMPDKNRNRKNKKHPVQAKWERHNRYFWVNFMNVIFSERNTVEFRLHTPTTNAQKMTNWLFICNAILKYAMNNSNKILLSGERITMDDILSYYIKFGTRGENLSEYLKAYIQSRKDSFLKDYKKGDIVSEWDYKQDDEYIFTHNNITNLF